MRFALSKWLTQIFLDCNIFSKGEINEVRIAWILKRMKGETKLTETTLITPTGIHTNKTNHQNKM